MTPNETSRLAHAINDLRPDWPISSLTTFITRELGGRAYRDAAVALVWVAVDVKMDGSTASDTPKRVLSGGPWWRAAAVEDPKSLTPTPPRREDQCHDCGRHLPCGCEHNSAQRPRPATQTAMATALEEARQKLAESQHTTQEACSDCGNKRCPKATHHNQPCTASNDLDQPGSRYSEETS